MFILNGTDDLSDAIPRLARLMHNIECGEKVYEWVSGSSSEALPCPEPDFIAFEVPGVTTDSPPTKVSFKPAVGYIYYVPDRALNIEAFAESLKAHLTDLPENHLTEHLHMEVAPRATLLHKGRINSDTKVIGPCTQPTERPSRIQHQPLDRRNIYIVNRFYVGDPMNHVSYRASFTWVITPITSMIQIEKFSSFGEFNACVSAVFLDTLIGGKESPIPRYSITTEYFGIPSLPSIFDNIEKDYYDADPIILIYVNGHMEPAGCVLCETLVNWSNPDRIKVVETHPPTIELSQIANLSQPEIEKTCGVCNLPLWGDVYANTNEKIAPQYMAFCKWCFGCFPEGHQIGAVKVSSNRSIRDAYKDSVHKDILPLMEARAEPILISNDENKRCFYLLELKEGGEKLILESTDTAEKYPPCLRVAELRDIRVPGLKWSSIAMLS